MGMVFEEVIRRFNEETNVTDAGRHFTTRDIVQLMPKQADNIKFGSTISNDKFRGRSFNFMSSNPPFGTSWKKELDSDEWGGIKKDEIPDTRFVINYDGGELRMVPDVDDPQMLFLANNVSKMKKANGHISRIVEVHNGSSLFTGKAGQGYTNLRRYILERDMLEAIIALPEKMFYNTGIGTYLWVLTSLKSRLRKNIGEKNCEITEPLREQIMEIYAAFVENEVKPYAEDAWYEEDDIKIGYEISFTKYFYKPAQLRKSADIALEIRIQMAR